KRLTLLDEVHDALDRLQLAVDRGERLRRDERDGRLTREELEELPVERRERGLVSEQGVDRKETDQPVLMEKRHAAERPLLLLDREERPLLDDRRLLQGIDRLRQVRDLGRQVPLPDPQREVLLAVLEEIEGELRGADEVDRDLDDAVDDRVRVERR